jgi:hypothetical protein
MKLKQFGMLALVTAVALFTSSCAYVSAVLLADDSLDGRNNNSQGSGYAQRYIIKAVSQYAQGLDSAQTGDAAFKQPFIIGGQLGTNILALIPGSDLADEYVIVGAHYDHIAVCTQKGVGDTICNGATDNATGVGEVIEIAYNLSLPENAPRRSVILAFWDREEDGLLGSAYYVSHPLVPIADAVAYINFDIQGSNLLPSLRQISFAIGAESGGPTFVSGVQAAIASQPLETKLFSSIFGLNRSDYVNFLNQSVPTVFFSDSTGPCYHTSGDNPSVIDSKKLNQQAHIATHLTLQLTNGLLTPTFTTGLNSVTFDDAVTLSAVVQTALSDLGRFSASNQAFITSSASTLAALVADGSAGFYTANGDITVLNIAAQLVNLLTSGTCEGFQAQSA